MRHTSDSGTTDSKACPPDTAAPPTSIDEVNPLVVDVQPVVSSTVAHEEYDGTPYDKLYIRYRILCKKSKLCRRRLHALRAVSALQFVPFIEGNFVSMPADVRNDTFGLFISVAVIHLEGCSRSLQNKLEKPFRDFLDKIAAILKIKSTIKHILLKPFTFRRDYQIGDSTGISSYGKPFADSVIKHCSTMTESIDESFYINRAAFINKYLLCENNSGAKSEDPSTSDLTNCLLEEAAGAEEGSGEPVSERDVLETTRQEEPVSSFSIDNSSALFIWDNADEKKGEDSVEDIDFYFDYDEYQYTQLLSDNGKQSSSNSKNTWKLKQKKKLKGGDTKVEAEVVLRDEIDKQIEQKENGDKNEGETQEASEEPATIMEPLDGFECGIKPEVDPKKDMGELMSSVRKRLIAKERVPEKELSILVQYLEEKVSSLKDLIERYERTLRFLQQSKIKEETGDDISVGTQDKSCTLVLPSRPPSPVLVLLRKLAGAYLLKHTSNARIHCLFQLLAASFNFSSEVMRCVEDYLVTDLAVVLQANKQAKSHNALRIAAVAAGGGALIAVTAGLAAPGVVAGLATLGIGSAGATAFFGSAGGVALIASLFGASGAGLAGWKFSRRVSDLKVFEFVRLNGEAARSLNLVICISGCLRTEDDICHPWARAIPSRNSDIYCLKWEPQLLLKVLSLAGSDLKKNLAVQASQLGLKYTAAAMVTAALSAPIAAVRMAANLDNVWMTLKERTKKGGEALADALMNKKTVGNRPVTLIGYSLGARLIFYCLMKLYEMNEFSLVKDVVLMGMPSTLDKTKWSMAREVVAGRLVNVYFGSDWLMGFLYRYMEWGIQLAALGPVLDVPGVTNYEVSNIVRSHADYADKLEDILSYIGLEMQ